MLLSRRRQKRMSLRRACRSDSQPSHSRVDVAWPTVRIDHGILSYSRRSRARRIITILILWLGIRRILLQIPCNGLLSNVGGVRKTLHLRGDIVGELACAGWRMICRSHDSFSFAQKSKALSSTSLTADWNQDCAVAREQEVAQRNRVKVFKNLGWRLD